MTILIAVAVFIGVAAAVGGVAIMFRGETQTAVEDRLAVLTGSGTSASGRGGEESTLLHHPLDDVPTGVEAAFSRLLNLRMVLDQADMSISPTKFLMICAAVAGFGVLALAIAPIHIGFAPLGALLGFIPFAVLIYKRNKRLAAFGKQLPEALELMSRALRAGHSLGAGLHLVAQEMKEPLGKEFARCYEEQNFGIPLEEALEELTKRVPNLDLQFFTTAVTLQRQTGGDLAEILDKIGYLVRERFKIHGQIQALTGEGRLSGVVLLALPPVLFVVMFYLNPSYTMKLFSDPMGNRMLAGAIIMQFIGALVIRKIINIKV